MILLFLRRVFLDSIGTLPTPAEARRFIADTSKNKREKLIDHLLERQEYVDYSTMRWLDILRADQLKISPARYRCHATLVAKAIY